MTWKQRLVIRLTLIVALWLADDAKTRLELAAVLEEVKDRSAENTELKLEVVP